MSSEEPSTDTAPLAESPAVPADEKRSGGKLRFLLPLGIFGLLIVLFVFGLGNNPRLVPSPLIDKAVPKFSLPQLQGDGPAFTEKEFLGKVSLFNVWASWCVTCREEHPLLMQLAQTTDIPIFGLNYKDEKPDALRWLAQFGDPYTTSIVDKDGRVGIDWGVYGVPETFVVDHKGFIRYKHIGAIRPKDMEEKILPLVNELRQAAKQSAPANKPN
ncbi:MAG: DsbE family thiol:disulfide interchange protein [Gammaproteobacteria bacterium]|nr:MAG: DsbE family thiol:disulfide interchange protein [Gammaproteobacteria bacterium]